MIYTAIDTFYLTDEQLVNTPSRKDGVNEATETTLRIYGCDLIQESGILLRLPQSVMATGQVLLHRFYCKKSFARFNVKRVAASCVWLASKLEESPKKARQVLIVFHRMECRRENSSIQNLDPYSKKYSVLKSDLIRTERHLLKEMGFICHVEHPHKFISNYLATLETLPELTQEAWNLANDSLRTTLCVRFKSEVVACGVVYAAARRFQVPLPENPPWWKAFDAEKSGIDEVCRVLAHLYSLPKAQFIPLCTGGDTFTSSKSWDAQFLPDKKEGYFVGPSAVSNTTTLKPGSAPINSEPSCSKDLILKLAVDKPKESQKSHDGSTNIPIELDAKSKLEYRNDGSQYKLRENDRERHKDRSKARDSNREQEETEKDKVKDKCHRFKDKGRVPDHISKSGGHLEKSKHHLSRDHDYHSSHSSRDKDRHRHQSYS